jgi:hypothetical protein
VGSVVGEVGGMGGGMIGGVGGMVCGVGGMVGGVGGMVCGVGGMVGEVGGMGGGMVGGVGGMVGGVGGMVGGMVGGVGGMVCRVGAMICGAESSSVHLLIPISLLYRSHYTDRCSSLWGRWDGRCREPKWNSGSSPKVKTSGDPEFRLYEPLESQVSAPPQTRRPLEGCGDDAKRPDVHRV